MADIEGDTPIKTVADHQKAKEAWEKAGRPKPKPSGEPREAGRVKAGTVVHPELTKSPEELERGFVEQQIAKGDVPEGATVTSRNADGTPNEYEYKGEKYYAKDSLMYEMGWRSQAEYAKGQHMSAYGGHEGERVPEDSIVVSVKRGKETISVAIPADKPVKHRGLAGAVRRGEYKIPVLGIGDKRLLLAPEQVEGYVALSGEQQFEKAVELGLVPIGSTFVKSAVEDQPWGYFPPGVDAKLTDVRLLPVDAERAETLGEYASWQAAMALLASYRLPREVRDGIISPEEPRIDIAKYLRDHRGDTGTLYAAGFSGPQVGEAEKFNRDNFGIGQPPHMPEMDFALQYARDKGWDLRIYVNTASAEELRTHAARLTEIMDAYHEEYDPKVPLEAFVKNHLDDVGLGEPPMTVGVKIGEEPSPEAMARTLTPEQREYQQKQLRKAEELENLYSEIYGARVIHQNVASELASWFFQPAARVASPAYRREDITGLGLGVGAIQIATLLSPLWVPKINPVGTAKIPLTTGESVTVWSGVRIGKRPIVGRTPVEITPTGEVVGGKLVFGKKGVTLPEAEIVKGAAEGWAYVPEGALETYILDEAAMLRMGFTPEAVRKVFTTTPYLKAMTGRPSPSITQNAVTDPIDTLSDDGVEAVLRYCVNNPDKVEVVFGSTTMRQFLTRELLAEWKRLGRVPADIDIMLKGVTTEEAYAFTQGLQQVLQRTEGATGVWIEAGRPTLIKAYSRSSGAARHAVDIHYPGEPTPYPISGLRERAYGVLYKEPSAVVTLPGVGRFRMMALAETGKRKAASILEWRLGDIGPAQHRMKDVTDFYIIVKRLFGADEAAEWAAANGYDELALAKLAADSPGFEWTFVPYAGAESTAIAGAVPIVSILSPGLTSAAISTPIGTLPSGAVVYASPNSFRSPTMSSMIFRPPPDYPSLRTRRVEVSPSILAIRPSLPLVSVVPSGAPSVPPLVGVGVPSSAPRVPKTPVSPSLEVPSAPVSPPPAPKAPVSPPSVPPVPPYKPPPPPPPTTIVVPLSRVGVAEGIEVPSGSIAWRQGAPFGKEQIKYIPPPYNQLKPISLLGRRPVGWVDKGRTPQETLQVIGKAEALPGSITVDLGITDAFISTAPLNIEFAGKGLQTDVGTRIPGPTKGMDISALKFGTTFEEALAYQPSDEAQKEFIEARIREMISEMPVEEFVQRVREVEIPDGRILELLEYMPDKERIHAITLLREEELFVPVGHERYARLRPSWSEKEVKLPSEAFKRLSEMRKGKLPSETELAALILSPKISEQEAALRAEKGILTKKELQQRRYKVPEKTKEVIGLRDIL